VQNINEIGFTKRAENSSLIFACLFIIFAANAAIVIGWQPLALSIATIFLFAGVHNFFEFRYFIARMPVRWGKSRIFYSVGIGGVLLLTTAYLAIYFGGGNWLWSTENSGIIIASWNTAFVLWIAFLVYLRGKHRPKTDWSLAFAFGFLVAALAWLLPHYWSLSLVYIHPFVAMWFLERQIRRTKPNLLKAYHFCLATIPLFVIGLWIAFANSSDLSNETALFARISQHAGSEILPQISSRFLVATHVFLETIHYSVWILVIPFIDRRAIPWRLKEIPLYSNENGFPKIVLAGLAFSLLIVVVLWIGFATDYSTTRDLYFAFAMAHVLAEMPFLIKML
jgi:hypothetical protein